jgi:Asp-tRNA(Asn)/Glu-tRNA(Gln) amidotransferase A subunit family amidase
MTSFEIGTDIGGSVRVRQRSAVYGHKPSFGGGPDVGYLIDEVSPEA